MDISPLKVSEQFYLITWVGTNPFVKQNNYNYERFSWTYYRH